MIVDITPRSDLDPEKLRFVAGVIESQVAVYDVRQQVLWFPGDGYVGPNHPSDLAGIVGMTDDEQFHFLDHPADPAGQIDVWECQVAIVEYRHTVAN